MQVTPHYDKLFTTNYKRLKRIGRVSGQAAETVAIGWLYQLNLYDHYTVRVKTRGSIRLFRLRDCLPKRPTLLMIREMEKDNIPIPEIFETHGAWRNFDDYPEALRQWEDATVETAGINIGMRRPDVNIPESVTMAAIVMYGEIRATRGTVVGFE